MGAYLSEPITEKVSSDNDSERVRYGASSMQGWRVSQEDAHNCVIDFDKHTSLFAVYDGHGGHEVAVYCSQKLPQFIKETEAYRNDDLKAALIDAFLGFDATIASRDVVAVLKEIAGVKDADNAPTDLGSDDDEEENVRNLYEEASMPIEQLMEKYQYQANLLNPSLKKLQPADKVPVSPMLKARKLAGECSGSAPAKPSGSGRAENAPAKPEPVVVSGSEVSCSDSLSTTSNGETSTKSTTEDSKCSSEPSVEMHGTTKAEPQSPEGDAKKTVANGESTPENNPTAQENGELSPAKGKGKALVKRSAKKEAPTGHQKVLRVRNARQLYSQLLDFEEEESDSEDDNDITFEEAAAASHSSSEDAGDDDDDEESSEGADDEDEGEAGAVDEEDDDEDDEEPDLYEDEDNEFTRNMTEEPGSDSGCTAVVALLRGTQLYVANAGDSRCIVCRSGQAVEMSLDHKPEDEPEMTRVLRAGGKVTQDGRVNGGLNLSRAIGDHAYKQNRELSASEQMITALPDVRTLSVHPPDDEFMVLACDGIWNFMSSQEVVDFVRPRLHRETGPDKLSQICEEMFEHCLAPHTMGDGTGCDNMTAIIVQFKEGSLKRGASPGPEAGTKRAKTDD